MHPRDHKVSQILLMCFNIKIHRDTLKANTMTGFSCTNHKSLIPNIFINNPSNRVMRDE